ncbi:MAG: hypothetical protein R3245_08960, partial [Kiloniellales bacterium]|nr:hypothetical protein [Kiloniellales bacterium]
DELRLHEESFHELKRHALFRSLALGMAGRLDLKIEKHSRNSRKSKRREAQGLFSAKDYENWLRENSMEETEFESLIDAELLVEEATNLPLAAITDHLLAQLKLTGDYARLAERARRKHEILLQAGYSDPNTRDNGLSPVDLVAWFFEKHLGRSIPEDLDEYTRSLDLSSREQLYGILVREYLYSLHSS